MADESNVHVKVAMAEVLTLFLVGFFTILVAMFGLKVYDDLEVILAVAPWVGVGLLVATYFAYVNENLLLTAIAGPLGIFLLAFGGITGAGVAASGATAVAFIGVVFLIDALVSLAQPVKLLPVLLFLAAIAFFMTALWWNDITALMTNDFRMIMGVFWLLVAALATYMAAAILMLVLKGKPVLPLLIKA